MVRTGLILGVLCAAPIAFSQHADTIFTNAVVLTLDAENSVRQGVAVSGDRILAVGSNAEVLQHVGPNTRVRNLDGRSLIPGFIDAHGHFPLSGVIDLYATDLSGPPVGRIDSIPVLLSKLRQHAKRIPKDEWVVGMNYDDTMLEEQRHPTREELDRISTEHPVIVIHSSLHFVTANSYALNLAGITKDTPQPAGGRIRKNPDTGEPTGVLEEIPAFGRVVVRIPQRTIGMDLDAIDTAAYDYARQGVTTAQNSNASAPDIRGLTEAARRDRLPIRVIVLPSYQVALQRSAGGAQHDSTHEPTVFFGAAKIIQDGSIQGYTGYLGEPYHTPFHGDADYRGYPTHDREKLTAIASKLHDAGWQLAIHANGDAAIDDTLHALRQVQASTPRDDSRPIIIHAQMTRDDQLDEMAELGAIPSFFALHTYYWGDRHRAIFMGPERAARISPARSALEKGVRFTIHCDTPVVPMEPLRLVWAAVNRKTLDGQLLGEDQRLTVVEALRATTIDAAYQHFLEDDLGSIETGKFADLVVLDEDPRRFPSRVDQVRVLETIVGGETIYRGDTQ